MNIFDLYKILAILHLLLHFLYLIFSHSLFWTCFSLLQYFQDPPSLTIHPASCSYLVLLFSLSLSLHTYVYTYICVYSSQKKKEPRWCSFNPSSLLNVVGSCSFNPRKTETGGSLWAIGQPCLLHKLQDSQNYIVRSCLKKKKTAKMLKQTNNKPERQTIPKQSKSKNLHTNKFEYVLYWTT